MASGKTPYVRFDLNDYSFPARLVRRPLTLIASETTVRIVDVETEVARHVRSYARGRRIEDRAHLEQLADDKRRASELRGRDRLTDVCPAAGALLEQVALRGGLLGGTTQRGCERLAPASGTISRAIRRPPTHPRTRRRAQESLRLQVAPWHGDRRRLYTLLDTAKLAAIDPATYLQGPALADARGEVLLPADMPR